MLFKPLIFFFYLILDWEIFTYLIVTHDFFPQVLLFKLGCFLPGVSISMIFILNLQQAKKISHLGNRIPKRLMLTGVYVHKKR